MSVSCLNGSSRMKFKSGVSRARRTKVATESRGLKTYIETASIVCMPEAPYAGTEPVSTLFETGINCRHWLMTKSKTNIARANYRLSEPHRRFNDFETRTSEVVHLNAESIIFQRPSDSDANQRFKFAHALSRRRSLLSIPVRRLRKFQAQCRQPACRISARTYGVFASR